MRVRSLFTFERSDLAAVSKIRSGTDTALTVSLLFAKLTRFFCFFPPHVSAPFRDPLGLHRRFHPGLVLWITDESKEVEGKHSDFFIFFSHSSSAVFYHHSHMPPILLRSISSVDVIADQG